MKSIVKTISGSGLSISGVLMVMVALSGLNRERIAEYGIMHELNIFGGAIFEAIFITGIVFIILGIAFILWGLLFMDNDRI